ncbi:MAG: rod shape-determining protein MreC [Candidatus Doudnabacteria bacterium]|nr:rod shape-determining protein MreC [Candidatus Doudnabacteria bacterium]
MRFIYTKAFAIFASCLAVLAILVFMQAKGWLDPLKLALLESPRPVIIMASGVTVPVKNFFSTIYQLRQITVENKQLQDRVNQLQQDMAQYQELTRENQDLRTELGFVKSSQLPLAACAVLSKNSFIQTDAVILNCGTDEGVGVGQAVLSQGYLAGKIISVGPHTSTALLITASSFSTDANVSQTGQSAIVMGSFSSGIILDQVPQTSALQTGWLVVTAGINPQVPKNIVIGQVSQILSSGNDLFKRAALLSPIDFSNLQFVFVVKQ